MDRNKRFQGQVALVTGAALGIGNAIAHGLAEEGARVLILDISVEDGEEAARAVVDGGGQAAAITMDATDPQQVRETVGEIIDEYGRIDVLVNNVGGNQPTPFLESDEALWRQLLELNLMSTLRFCHAVLPHMIAQQYGRVVNIASIAGIHPWPGSVIYGVAKAGVVSLSRSLAADMASHNIRVNCICPGPTETTLSKLLRQTQPEYVKAIHGMVTLGRLADPQEIAAAVLFLASEESSFVLGECMVVDGGYNMV